MKNRLDYYKLNSSFYWNQEYKNIDWKVTHNAGSKQKTVALATREIDLFLFPTEDKIEKLLADKENNPYPTFTRDFINHKNITEYISDLSKAVALDYGCGSLARYSIELSKRFKMVYGVDISSEAIKLAKEEVSNSGARNICLRQNNGISVPFPNNFFDFIFSNLVLQHIGNIEVNYELAKEFIRVLKPGGVMRVEYLDGSQRKDDLHAHPSNGNGITREDLIKMYESGATIQSISEEHPWLWVTISKGKP